MMAMLTLGNLGHAETYCEHSFLALNSQTHIGCDTGRISQIKSYGIMPSQGQF